MKTKIKAFGYLRVSGKGQMDGDGFTRQEEAIQKYARANKQTVVDVFRDGGVSGTKELADREGLAALFDGLDSNGVRLVLVERADRIARDLIVGEIILGQFRERGVQVVEVEGGTDLTVADGDPTRKLIRQILGAVAEFDKSVIVAKLRAARDRMRRKDGRCEGRKPYGAKPEEAAVVERIKTLRGEGRSLRDIAAALDAEKAPTRTGAKWSAMMVKNVVDRAPAGP